MKSTISLLFLILTLLLTLTFGSALPSDLTPDSIPARSASSTPDSIPALSSRQAPDEATGLLLDINDLESRQQGSCGSPFEPPCNKNASPALTPTSVTVIVALLAASGFGFIL